MAGIPYPALPLADVCFSCFLGFSALKGNGLPASDPSLLLHGWVPAGFSRGLPRCCFYRDSHGEGKGVSPWGESMPGFDFLSCWYMVKGARKEVTLVPWRAFLTENAPARPSYNGENPPHSSILSLFLTAFYIGYANFAKSTLFMELHLFC